jgi:hypothetical protein
MERAQIRNCAEGTDRLPHQEVPLPPGLASALGAGAVLSLSGRHSIREPAAGVFADLVRQPPAGRGSPIFLCSHSARSLHSGMPKPASRMRQVCDITVFVYGPPTFIGFGILISDPVSTDDAGHRAHSRFSLCRHDPLDHVERYLLKIRFPHFHLSSSIDASRPEIIRGKSLTLRLAAAVPIHSASSALARVKVYAGERR